jgi:hypothetical protein
MQLEGANSLMRLSYEWKHDSWNDLYPGNAAARLLTRFANRFGELFPE